ncbi:50S ribosomal protein L9 [Flavobacteriales bacterium]|nr:50S ribosomal protein L9 [Flavobacteriales bacterium]
MDVILKTNVDSLGEKDELVSVKAGYGRNYLIPQGKAILATASAKKMHEETLRQRSHKASKMLEEAKALAEKLQNVTIKIGAKVGEAGKIFGSVNTVQLAESLKTEGFQVDRKSIKMENDSIKEVGTYKATVKLQKEVIVDINFEVVEE